MSYKAAPSILFLLWTNIVLLSQDRPHIDSLVNQGKSICLEYPDSSLIYSVPAYEMSVRENYYWGIVNASQWISEAFYAKGEIDSALVYDHISLDAALVADDQAEIANNYVAIASKLTERGDHVESVRHFEMAQKIMEERKDTLDLEDMHQRLANVYINQDKLDEAMYHYNLGYKYALALRDTSYISYGLSGMAYVQKKMENYEKAIELSLESLEYLRAVGDEFGIMVSYNNRGIMYKDIGDYTSALSAYDTVFHYAELLNFERGFMSAGINSGILYNQLERYDQAIPYLEKALEVSQKYERPISEADATLGLAEAYLGKKINTRAATLAAKGLDLAVSVGSVEKQLKGNKLLAKINEIRNPTLSISYLKESQLLRDSIFRLEKAKQIDEIQTQYETAKKEAEIINLTKEAELSTQKRKALFGGLVLLSILGVSIILGIQQRRKRDKLILERDKELEIEKRKSAEQELEHKQKELTTKVLQLAGKNEFLQKLEEQVSELKSSVDDSVHKASSKIARMINYDASDGQEWEQFSKEFTSIHSSFLGRLKEKHVPFSKSEMRLISLLKMNLSSKEIANTLRISDDGVKKARYRLRKKMELASDTDIQDYILNL